MRSARATTAATTRWRRLYRNAKAIRPPCPPWFAPDDDTGRCMAGPSLDGLIEQDLSLLQTCVMPCNCVTEEDGVLTVGFCLHECAELQYTPLPCDARELQNWSCPYLLNKRGVLCSQCIEGYAIPVYSYTLGCVECEHYRYNWLKYLVAAYAPLTFLYIVVAIFTINFASPTLSGAIMFFQIAGNPTVVQMTSNHWIFPPFVTMLIQGAFSFASFWNLDFSREYYTFCLHPKASAELILALEFGKAVFPVILIVATVILVKAHDNNYRILAWGWKLVRRLRNLVRHNARTSLIEVFATFVYLLSCRVFLTSMFFLVPFASYNYYKNSDGDMVLEKKYRLLFAPSVKYFGKEHIPYAILAIVMSTLFFTIPLLLQFLYPFSWFQEILNKIRCNFIVLRIFMDVFQGYYKDGTNGTKDYRFLSGFTMLVPVALDLIFAVTKSAFLIPITCIVLLLFIGLHLIFLPFKYSGHNKVMVVMLSTLLCAVFSMIDVFFIPSELSGFGSNLAAIVFVLLFSVPFLYIIVLPLYKICKSM